MTIYVVTRCDEHPIAAFSTQEAAEAFVKEQAALHPHGRWTYMVDISALVVDGGPNREESW